jgi:hypothetical protein
MQFWNDLGVFLVRRNKIYYDKGESMSYQPTRQEVKYREILQSIAERLTGIERADLTTCEKSIVNVLVTHGILVRLPTNEHGENYYGGTLATNKTFKN